MSLHAASQRDHLAAGQTTFLEIVDPGKGDRSPVLPASLSPEACVKMRNYRRLNNVYTSDIVAQSKDALVPKFDVCTMLSPPRSKILELLRPEDPGRDALEAIVRPVPRRGLTRPLDEDTQRFLHRALQSAAPYANATAKKPECQKHREIEESMAEMSSSPKSKNSSGEVSLAEELMKADEEEKSGCNIRRELISEFRRRGGGIREEVERERLAKLALSVEEDEGEEDGGLSAAARRIDALLAESRNLHEELAEIQEDLQVESARAFRCTAVARALVNETQATRYLDDVVALLRGDVTAAVRVKAWPFAIGRRQPDRNYVI